MKMKEETALWYEISNEERMMLNREADLFGLHKNYPPATGIQSFCWHLSVNVNPIIFSSAAKAWVDYHLTRAARRYASTEPVTKWGTFQEWESLDEAERHAVLSLYDSRERDVRNERRVLYLLLAERRAVSAKVLKEVLAGPYSSTLKAWCRGELVRMTREKLEA